MSIRTITEEPFTCERGGLTIRGMLYFPIDFTADKRYPVAVMSHGFTGNYTDMTGFCQDWLFGTLFQLLRRRTYWGTRSIEK